MKFTGKLASEPPPRRNIFSFENKKRLIQAMEGVLICN